MFRGQQQQDVDRRCTSKVYCVAQRAPYTRSATAAAAVERETSTSIKSKSEVCAIFSDSPPLFFTIVLLVKGPRDCKARGCTIDRAL